MRRIMGTQSGKLTGDTACEETRQHRRAFRKAVSSGLRRAFQPGKPHSLPSDFIERLQKADSKTAKP